MTQSPLAMLDQEELLQLAITSGRRNDTSAALSYLKEAVSRPDASAKAYFLLGAEYAEINLYDRAIANMEMALALDPSLHIARFQLGLLVLSCGEGLKAEIILQPLSDVPSPLSDFAKGLIELMHDQFQLALDLFQQGMSQNNDNPALQENIQRIIESIKQLPDEVYNPMHNPVLSHDSSYTPPGNPAEEAEDPSILQHILLSAYTGTKH